MSLIGWRTSKVAWIGSREFLAKPNGEIMGELQWAINAMIGDLDHKNKVLVSLVKAMCNEIVELKGELMRLKTIGGIGTFQSPRKSRVRETSRMWQTF